jgi:DNA end-binding protein Ku
VHASDGAPIQHRRVCPNDGEEVPYEHVVKGFEVGDGEYVELTQAELKAAAGARSKRIDLEDFVAGEEIDPVFYDRTYYLGARQGSEGAYRLLYEAIRRSGRVGIARWVFHDRERLVAIRCLGRVLALHTMRYHDELVSGKELELPHPGRAPTSREVEMAVTLVESLESDFDPGRYRDTYRDAVMRVIELKAAGKPIEPEEPPQPEPGPDLATALQQSLRDKGVSAGRRRDRTHTSGHDDQAKSGRRARR